jgi:alpha-tubulin suppressor-like RCC1 family protein
MTQYVRAINIANNSIKAFVFDTNTANTLNSAVVAESVAISANVSAQAVNTFVTLQVQQVANTPPTINVISITDSSYNVLDDTAANTNGAYLQITGSNFQSGAIVMVGSSNTALTTTLVNSNTLRAQIPAITSGTYPVYVVNTNGGTGIRINGLTTSSFPAWSTGTTLSNQVGTIAFSVNLSASSDSNITYSNTTTLPAGTTLAANGLFSGTVSPSSNTTYNFTVKANDAENQDASRTFSVTVTVPPQTRLYAWGRNQSGSLGLNDTVTYRSSPTQVGTGTTWSQISAAQYFTMATKTDGTLWMWGINSSGQLGLNDRVNRSSPTQVGVLTTWNQISVGRNNTMATKTDGTLWLWGSNNYGALGINAANFPRSSPIQVGSGTTWNLISAGLYSTLATKTDGTLWAWGRNSDHGQLGLNNTANSSSPVQVGGNTNWSKISASQLSTIATKTDGTLWAWGGNDNGQLGINNVARRSSPVQIGSSTNWNLLSTGYYATMAIKTDGTLWMWGRNDQGQLGLNNVANRSSPTQVGVATNWSQISTGIFSTTAIKTDGTLWTWGYNAYGQLGFNDVANRSSPVQVEAATNWSRISVGTHNTMAITYNP